MDRSRLYDHLKACGPISRANPELIRLHKESGFGVEHLLKVALGYRPASLACAKALVRASKNKAITLDSLWIAGQK